MDNRDIPNQQIMRVLGGSILVSSIIQMAVAGAAYDLTNWHVGSWWAGLFAFICAVFAVISNAKPVVSAGCGFSVLAILLCFIGTILDGVFYGITHNLDTCYERQTNTVYGDTSYLLAAEACVVGHSQDCMCVSGDDTDECYLFNLKGADDCGLILTTLPDNLLTSMFFLLLLLFLLFTYSVFTCMIVCVEPDRDVYIQDNNNGPAQSSNPPVATAAAAAYPSYVQTQTPAVAKAYVQPPVLKAEPAPQPPAPQPTAVTSNPINNYGYV